MPHMCLGEDASESKQALMHSTAIASTEDTPFNYQLLMNYFIIQ